MRKVPALHWMSKLEFAPVFDLHQSPPRSFCLLSPYMRSLLRSWPGQRNIAAAPRNSPCCPSRSISCTATLQLAGLGSCFAALLLLLLPSIHSRAFALRLLAVCTSQGTTEPIASLRTLIGVLANLGWSRAETPCSFCSSTSWGHARETTKET
jgi:hypothetical protein